jgi:predicted RNase H-like HicB family nuclease
LTALWERLPASEWEVGMLDLRYSLVIEATEDPSFFCFYSPDLEGFTGVGHSVEDCLYKARWGMLEHIQLFKEEKLPIPRGRKNPRVIIQNAGKLRKAG